MPYDKRSRVSTKTTQPRRRRFGRIIDGVSRRCAKFCGLDTFARHTRVAVYLIRYQTFHFPLTHWIQVSIQSMTWRASPDDPQRKPILPSAPGRLPPAYVVEEPTGEVDGGPFDPGVVEITYETGWPTSADMVDTPPDIARAVERQCADEWFGRRQHGHPRGSMAGSPEIRCSMGAETPVPPLREALEPYRKISLL